MRTTVAFLLMLVAFVIAGWAIPAGFADGRDHDRARGVLESGRILPLSAILSAVERDFEGEVLEIELEDEEDEGSGVWIYEIKLLTSSGSVIALNYDAASGTLIGAQGRGLEQARRGRGNRRD